MAAIKARSVRSPILPEEGRDVYANKDHPRRWRYTMLSDDLNADLS